MMREAEQGANAAQAQKNASEIGALASVASNAAQATAQQMSGGVGEKPQYETEQEKKQNQAAVENAVAGAMSETRLAEGKPASEDKSVEKKPIDTSVKPDIASAAFGMQDKGSVENPDERPDTGAKMMSDLNKEDASSANAVDAQMQANKDYEKLFSDRMNDYWNRKNEEEKEMRMQEQANMMSSMASGTTELAAGIINMLSVGELGATHQQYNNPSADWMKKADADIKANRERRRSMADTLDRLKEKYAEVKTANRLDEIQALQKYKKEQEALAIQRAQLQLKQQQEQRQAAENAAEAERKAAETASKIAVDKERVRASQTASDLKRDEAAQNAAKNGLVRNADGTYSVDVEAMKKIQEAKSNKTTGTKAGGEKYGIVVDGQPTTVRMSKETYAQGIKTGTEELKQDILDNATEDLKAAGIKVNNNLTWDSLVELSSQKKIVLDDGTKIDNPLYGKDLEIISALNGSGDNKADYEVIERYVKDNKSKVNKFNKHLQSLAATEEEIIEEEKGEGTWEEEFN